MDILGPEQAKELLASFEVDPQDDYVCAKIGRLWEELLENYPNNPFLLLRVAEMRFALGRKMSSLQLYQRVSGVCIIQSRPTTYFGIAPNPVRRCRFRYMAQTIPRIGDQ